MELSILAASLCVLLFGFGCWAVTEGDRVIAAQPAMASTVRANQFWFVSGSGLIATMVYVGFGLTFAPNSPITPWAPACMFTMPLAPFLGALAMLMFKKILNFIRK